MAKPLHQKFRDKQDFQDEGHKVRHFDEIPVGTILPFGGSTAPAGWKLCDGSAISRTRFAYLFRTIGTSFGVGDGSTTFQVPDLRSRAPMGVGTFLALGGTAGAGTEANRTPSHSHGSGSLDVTTDHTSAENTTVGGGAHRTTSEAHAISGTTGLAGGPADFPAVGVNFIIKTGAGS
jgi:microcystin-dependent protein